MSPFIFVKILDDASSLLLNSFLNTVYYKEDIFPYSLCSTLQRFYLNLFSSI